MNIKVEIMNFFSGLDKAGGNKNDVDSSLEFNVFDQFINGNKKIKLDNNECSFSSLKPKQKAELQSIFGDLKNKHNAMLNSDDEILITDANVKQYADLLSELTQSGAGLDEMGEKNISKIKKSLAGYIMKNNPNADGLADGKINYSGEINDILISKADISKFKEADDVKFNKHPEDGTYITVNGSQKMCYYQGLYFCPDYPDIKANKNSFAVAFGMNRHYETETAQTLDEILQSAEYSEDTKKEMLSELCEKFAVNKYEAECTTWGIESNAIEYGPKSFSIRYRDDDNNTTKEYTIPYEVVIKTKDGEIIRASEGYKLNEGDTKIAYFDKDKIYSSILGNDLS